MSHEFPFRGGKFVIAPAGNLEVHLDDGPAWRFGLVQHADIPDLVRFLSGRNGRSSSRAGSDPG